MNLELIRKIARKKGGKIVLLVLDGLGGLPAKRGKLTPLEAAQCPNLDALAAGGITGLHEPVGPGITPGSGPGHLSLFGYDPLKYEVGRGVFSALGVNFDLRSGDVAARGNFCTLEEDGTIADRRAGRISSERGRELCDKLKKLSLEGVEIFVEPVKEHRFLLVLRGQDLHAAIQDTDPHETGRKRNAPQARVDDAERTSGLVRQVIEQADGILAEEEDGNSILLRGFDNRPELDPLPEVSRMRCKAIAAYPMYCGVARLLGMDVIDVEDDFGAELDALEKAWDEGDFFFIHVKRTDSLAEDGAFEAKRDLIERLDKQLPRLTGLKPDVLVVTGDHSTPARLASHSWHPVPILLHAPETVRPDGVERFGESSVLRGALGPRFPGPEILPLAMAHARRLAKFGA
jgi:2,3-bisphosphoglycerate-independent phosphoglycerate mutase